jgi:hypothetical protein
MKIGVFGDSYADKNAGNDVWFNRLFLDYGHDVTSFGEMGSSIMFSATLIQAHAKNFDLVIWCLTTPGRYSFQLNGKQYHNVCERSTKDSSELSQKIQAYAQWLTYMYDRDEENFIGQTVVNYLQNMYDNIMIVPCFPEPLLDKNHLYQVCETETQHYFPGWPLHEVNQKYRDLRPGHLTAANQKILADMINNNLVPGVLNIDYNKFVTPTEPFENCFCPHTLKL